MDQSKRQDKLQLAKIAVYVLPALNPTPTVEVLHPAQALVGEGPVYEEDTRLLFWVDVNKNTVNIVDSIEGTNRSLLIIGANL